ncbi:MAG: molybdopterin-binding protein [Nitrospirota bacterium]
MERTAGVIIIGDEILSGMIQDTNSFFVTGELRRIGIALRRIAVIGDDIDTIADEVAAFSSRFDYVITSGGIGPTHDDVTIAGIAKAFGVAVVIDTHLRAFLERHYSGTPTPEQLRMAEAPEGASVIQDTTIGLPLIVFRNIYILPGIPEYFRMKVTVLARLLHGGKPPSVRRVYVTEYESRIAPLLNEIVRDFPAVKIGSYPVVGRSDYSVMVTMESYDEEALAAALSRITGGLSRDKILRVEE